MSFKIPFIRVNDFSFSGKTVTISNGRIVIDGKQISTKEGESIRIEIHGDLDSLKIDACNEIIIHGNVKGNVQTGAGNITCENVGGDVSSMAGNINCDTVAGGASTMAGNVTVRK